MEKLRNKQGFICDMDGVLYHGNRLLPGVKKFVDWLYKENKKSWSCSRQLKDSRFDYRGVEKALVQKPRKVPYQGPTFTTKRFIVIQMKEK